MCMVNDFEHLTIVTVSTATSFKKLACRALVQKFTIFQTWSAEQTQNQKFLTLVLGNYESD